MQEWRGLWLPDGETHLIDWMRKMNQVVDGKPTYQWDKQQLALSFVRNWRVAVDVGAHCGLWSMHLAKRFKFLHAFEPVAAHRECFIRNVPESYDDDGAQRSVFLWDCALGDRDDKVSIYSAPSSSGDSYVKGAGDIPLQQLDEFGCQNVDFIKLDCEGYELFALRGAEETLKRCRPCVIVEQKPGRAQKFGLPETGAVDYLQSLGATLRAKRSGDYVLSWDA